MNIKQIILENFRNHTKNIISFSEKTTIFIGENGSGKTNIIEAIYSFAILKPFRSTKREIYIKEEENYSKLTIEANQKTLEIYWEKTPARTVFKKDKIKLKTSEFLKEKEFYAVLFTPDDLNLPFSSPSERRKLLFRVVAPVHREYFESHLKFEKILRQRNKLLQRYAEQQAEKSEFEYWDQEFIKHSQILTQYRKDFLKYINSKIEKYFQEISQNKKKLSINFIPSSENIAEDLEKNFQKDIIIGSTSRGAHRDDFQILINDENLTKKASRGEVRSAILAFKLAERDFIQENKEIKPLLLFDDVFSELDEIHRRSFLKLIKNEQAVINSTETPVFLSEPYYIYEVKNGEVSKIN